MRQHLAWQLGLFGLVLVVVAAVARGGRRDDWIVIAAWGPLALAFLGPSLSAWNRRVSAWAAVGVPLLAVVASNVAVWVSVAIVTSHDPICDGPHVPCEGVGIFLAFYPFYAAATVVLAGVLAGGIRGVAALIARMRASR